MERVGCNGLFRPRTQLGGTKLEYILQAEGISKQYGKTLALDHVTLQLKKGEIYGLIGRNGAGKTTLLKILAGLAKPTDGTFSIFGESQEKTKILRDRIGVLLETPGLYPNMSAYENMKLKELTLGMNDDAYVHQLLQEVGLSAVEKKPVKKFSLGMKQRLGIAMALVGHPDLLLLDEPINGIDPQGIVEIRELIERLSHEYNVTVIISSHILEELSKIATRFGILHRGRLIDTFTHEELMKRCSERIEIRTSDPVKACMVIEKMGITEFKIMDGSMIQIFERMEDSGEIVLELAKNNIKTLSIQVKNEALEDYYLSLTMER